MSQKSSELDLFSLRITPASSKVKRDYDWAFSHFLLVLSFSLSPVLRIELYTYLILRDRSPYFGKIWMCRSTGSEVDPARHQIIFIWFCIFPIPQHGVCAFCIIPYSCHRVLYTWIHGCIWRTTEFFQKSNNGVRPLSLIILLLTFLRAVCSPGLWKWKGKTLFVRKMITDTKGSFVLTVPLFCKTNCLLSLLYFDCWYDEERVNDEW